jgi:pimeloyl-ACP methyl ester carboxylesterase
MSDLSYENREGGQLVQPRRTSKSKRRGKIFLLGLALTIISLLTLGAAFQAIATWVDARKYPPPGQLVDVGGYELHIYCQGEGNPVVVLDALFPGTVSNWAWVLPEIATETRVCAYDRAGLGWSESGPEPRDALKHAHELHTLLTNGGIPGKYILVGHSLGGLSVRMFADKYPDEVAGMVLIEATNPDAWQRLGLPEGIGADPNQLALAPILARFGLFRLGLLSAYSLDPDLPSPQRQELQAFFNTVKSLKTVRAVDSSFSVALEQVRNTGDLGSKPLAIVLGSKGDGSNEQLQDLFIQQAALSSDSYSQMIEGATHAGLVDNQEHALQTSTVILRVLEAVRSGQPVSSE